MVTTSKLIEIVADMCDCMQRNMDYLNELDSPIGDKDHGTNMARGFQAVSGKLPALAQKDAGTILKTVGMTVVSTAGGACGPLYGTAFMKAGAKMAGKRELTIDDLVEMLHEAVAGIQMRGKVTFGQKTMLDAMIPTLEAVKNTQGSPAERVKAGAAAAVAGAEATRPWTATKGRASYLGERSQGHLDPGAVSFALLFSVIAKHCG